MGLKAPARSMSRMGPDGTTPATRSKFNLLVINNYDHVQPMLRGRIAYVVSNNSLICGPYGTSKAEEEGHNTRIHVGSVLSWGYVTWVFVTKGVSPG